MDHNDLANLYHMAASGEEALHVAEPSEAREEASFKLQACVTWARVQLQEAGFETEQMVSDDMPELLLKVSRDGNAHSFRLCIPKMEQDGRNKTPFGKNIVLAGNVDGSLSAFRIYEDDGSISMGRFESLSAEIARHVAIECGKKASVRNAPAAAM